MPHPTGTRRRPFGLPAIVKWCRHEAPAQTGLSLLFCYASCCHHLGTLPMPMPMPPSFLKPVAGGPGQWPGLLRRFLGMRRGCLACALPCCDSARGRASRPEGDEAKGGRRRHHEPRGDRRPHPGRTTRSRALAAHPPPLAATYGCSRSRSASRPLPLRTRAA